MSKFERINVQKTRRRPCKEMRHYREQHRSKSGYVHFMSDNADFRTIYSTVSFLATCELCDILDDIPVLVSKPRFARFSCKYGQYSFSQSGSAYTPPSHSLSQEVCEALVAVCRDMAKRGARNLILIFRSGNTSYILQGLVSNLESQGVKIATPVCDVSDLSALLPKVAGSWSLSRAFPAKLDFFVLLSSIATIWGNGSTGN